jgi:L-threonylcarbamoyladenylate synthase
LDKLTYNTIECRNDHFHSEQTLAKPIIDIQQQIEQGISALRKGGLVAYPTDTVYGLGAAMNVPEAVERIYAVKRRPSGSPLPLLVADMCQISEVASDITPMAHCFIRNFFPGALTLVLSKSKAVPEAVTRGGGTVAIRIPDHPVPVALIKGLGSPIVGTSANRSGQPSALTAEEVVRQLSGKIAMVLDGGVSPGGKESTILDVTGEIPIMLREGAISREELERVCGKVVVKK